MPRYSFEGEALEAMGQAVRTAYQTRFAPFSQNMECRFPFIGADGAGGQA